MMAKVLGKQNLQKFNVKTRILKSKNVKEKTNNELRIICGTQAYIGKMQSQKPINFLQKARTISKNTKENNLKVVMC